jgi:hypothetical protein
MDVEEFSDDEWQDVFDELRLLINGAGFAEWDIAMIAALDEEFPSEAEIDRPVHGGAHARLVNYGQSFMGLLKTTSRYNLDRSREALGSLLINESGRPVDTVLIDVGGRTISLFDASPTDPMIEMLQQFLGTITGQDDAFWDDDIESPERGE